MAFVGTILQELMKIRKRIRKRMVVYDEKLQEKTLRKLLTYAQNTRFGQAYRFKEILRSEDIKKSFAKNVPVHDYNKLYDEWWHYLLKGEDDITWPGRIKHYALTSGTSGSPSKRVPVSYHMIKAIRKVSVRQMLSIPDFGVNSDFYQKSVLMIGGSTALKRIPAGFEGDLSGIMQKRIPRWFTRFYKPGKKIAVIKDWEHKLDAVAKEAKNWDIGVICGVPAWIQLLMEKIIKENNAKHIHEIWPNLNIYVHGGVSFTPYRESFKKLLGKEINYLDTYLASEGFIAAQNSDNKLGMQLVLDNWIYFEFVPFNEKNFDHEGQIKEEAEILTIEEVKENVDYAILISTCSGAWRYLIGDTIRFVKMETFEIIITGRTKHFLSLCGEHLSVDNMNMAVKKVGEELGVNINEYTVCGENYNGLFAHRWYVGVDKITDTAKLKEKLDAALKDLNDDYTTERGHALKEIFVEQLSIEKFYAFMDAQGKLGGQNKFPRVMKGKVLEDWKRFVQLGA
ncbi:MAG: GH3 family domain-containing protein [Bacteroidota bacterium]